MVFLSISFSQLLLYAESQILHLRPYQSLAPWHPFVALQFLEMLRFILSFIWQRKGASVAFLSTHCNQTSFYFWLPTVTTPTWSDLHYKAITLASNSQAYHSKCKSEGDLESIKHDPDMSWTSALQKLSILTFSTIKIFWVERLKEKRKTQYG